ncbi:MAG: site-specific DNA-methyltransferase [Chloroflexi bacterium]|nr:site-specific DNA-methyltransferase [Ardenticatenaceae bacterium]NOG35951.1 site-specific DNA-methyltransferase [Chloroflexota bacterium]GIK56210.1 MAG: site-specific DNA-methyltransferase [Chloroflexota bacterium]
MPLLKEQLALFTVPPDTPKVKQPANGYTFTYGNCQVGIKQEDCVQFLQSLPDQSVDIIVTDPAYAGMNNHLQLGRGRIVGTYEHKGSENGKWFAEFKDSEENYRIFLSECRRVLSKRTGHIYIMFDSFSLLTLGALVRDYFDIKNLITWDKINIGMGHYFRRRHEYVIFATNGNNRKIRNRTIPDIWRFKRIYRAQYVTQKPVELFQAMIFASAEDGFTVCDPFMGSGSSAIAAIKNNCNFIGCDISEKATDLSRKRIEHQLATGQDCLQPKPSHVPNEEIFWEFPARVVVS